MDAMARIDENEPPTAPSVRLKERLLYEFGPLVAFFVGNQVSGIETGTAVFMGATLLSLAANYLREGRFPVAPLFSTVLILIFGGLSLFYAAPWIIMVRPTIMNGFYAAVLLGGLLVGRNVLALVLKGSLVLSSDRAWRVLTWRAVAFLTLLAAANEITWRWFSVDVWVAFKTFAVLPMNAAFIAAQAPFVRRHRAPPPPEPGG